MTRRIQMKNLPTIKFYNSQGLQSLFWLFDHLFIRHGGSNIVHKSYITLL
jgi:hypothetical protein